MKVDKLTCTAGHLHSHVVAKSRGLARNRGMGVDKFQKWTKREMQVEKPMHTLHYCKVVCATDAALMYVGQDSLGLGRID